MPSHLLRRLAIGLAVPTVLTFGLSACGASDVSRADVEEQLTESELSDEQASCVTDRLFTDLEQGQINDLYEADTPGDVSDEINEVFNTALEECSTGE